MTHGITNRMTGGGTGRCLQTLESGGLGEGTVPSLSTSSRLYTGCSYLSFVLGWSDAMAEFVIFECGLQTRFSDQLYLGGLNTSLVLSRTMSWANMLPTIPLVFDHTHIPPLRGSFIFLLQLERRC